MNGKRVLLLGVLSVAMAVTTQAALIFEKTEVDLKPELGAANAIAVFKYENKGSNPIHIKAVRPSCGCTTAALAKNDVAPGEKGEITATFNIGDRTGTQTKTITVETDDAQQPQTVLTLKATIAQFLELQPSFVYWQAGEAVQPKTIIAKAGKGATVKKLDVTSSSAEFSAKVEPGSGPGEFKISVQPKDTAKPLNATLTIKPDTGSGAVKPYYAQARVVPGPATTTR
ncbi:MAG TPA: DUF1573 domain-containing protein [Chthoniobacterales bacterium]|jgi:hypothetical protein|nr:DUF1573 domain-containing protein [Chthoniobacterales bacterium]